jgi:transposase
VDPQVLLPPGAGLVVEQVRLRDEIIHLTVRREAAGANCPGCGAWSEAFHRGYERHLGDLPIAGRQAVVDLRVRRFRCYESKCQSKTFVEQAPVLVERLTLPYLYQFYPDKTQTSVPVLSRHSHMCRP